MAAVTTALLFLAMELTGRPSVIDGDTIEIAGERIRLHGIDAPESGQFCEGSSGQTTRCGQQAALALDEMIAGRIVTCVGSNRDQYGRTIAVCSVNEIELNEAMVQTGHALAFRRYSSDYIAAEEDARLNRVGIWEGRFVEPWNWRRGLRITAGGTSDMLADGDRDCSDFSSWQEAQRFFETAGPGDPHRLDADGDGLACQGLRE